MMLYKNQYVKCLLKNNVATEGSVIEFCDDYLKLLSLDGQEIFVLSPKDNIALIKIAQTSAPITAEESSADEQKLADLKKEFQNEINNKNANPYDSVRNKTLANLKNLVNQQEIKTIRTKINDSLYQPSKLPIESFVSSPSDSPYKPSKLTRKFK